jgi:transcriptional regulator with XRE-family HTH domain
MRERRIMLGLTQQQMPELIGVISQQAHKYEKGINRVSAGRLYRIAQALGVDVSYLFEGLETAGRFVPSPQQRMLLELTPQLVLTIISLRSFERTPWGGSWSVAIGRVWRSGCTLR